MVLILVGEAPPALAKPGQGTGGLAGPWGTAWPGAVAQAVGIADFAAWRICAARASDEIAGR